MIYTLNTGSDYCSKQQHTAISYCYCLAS